MEKISYISYSSTLKKQKRGKGLKGFVSYWLFLLPIMIVCAIFVSVSIIHLYVRNEIIKYSYLVPQENNVQKKLLEENKSLKAQYSFLVSPARIEKYAIERLKMRYPTPQDIYEIKDMTLNKDESYIGQKR